MSQFSNPAHSGNPKFGWPRMILKTVVRASINAERRAVRALRVLAVACLAVTTLANAAVGFSVRSDTDKKMFRIELATGVATELGDSGFSKIEALAINSAGELFGVNPLTAQLVKCSSTNGVCAAVGILPGIPSASTNVGLTFDASGRLVMAINAVVYTVDTATAATAVLGSAGAALSGLASGSTSASCVSGLYGVGGNSDQGKFYCINATTGAASQLGTLPSVTALDGGLDGDPSTGLVWGITNGTAAQIYSVDPATLVVSNARAVTVGGVPAGGFENLAVQPSAAAATSVEVPTLTNFVWVLLMFSTLAVGAATALRTRARI
jgi:hypothetical protein